MQTLSISSFRWIILLLGFSVLVLFALQAVVLRLAVTPVQAATDQLASVQQFALDSFSTRVLTSQLLSIPTTSTYMEAEQAFERLAASLDQMLRLASADTQYALTRLEQASSDYQNAFLGLQSLAVSDAAPASQAAVRQQLITTGAAFEQQVSALLQQSMFNVDQTVVSLSHTVIDSAVVLALVLASLFGLSLLLVFAITRHSAYALHQVGVAARKITQEAYETRIDVTGEANPNIVDLAVAFNRLAEKLQGALRSESAAQQQNQLQLLKLARQERKTAVLEERQRIARELHDSVKQQLFSMALSTSAAINLLEHSPDHVRTYLEHIQQSGHQAQSEMTALVQELVPVSMQDKRLDEALHTYLSSLCEMHNLKLLWRVEGTNTLTLAQEHAVFRAVQEAVANVMRHSGATVLRVSLVFGLLTHVIVEDNGHGFLPDAIPPTSTGLSLMQSRLKRAGGSYELQTAPGEGTRLTIVIDLRRAALVHA